MCGAVFPEPFPGTNLCRRGVPSIFLLYCIAAPPREARRVRESKLEVGVELDGSPGAGSRPKGHDSELEALTTRDNGFDK